MDPDRVLVYIPGPGSQCCLLLPFIRLHVASSSKSSGSLAGFVHWLCTAEAGVLGEHRCVNCERILQGDPSTRAF